jgi:hypothetical protein
MLMGDLETGIESEIAAQNQVLQTKHPVTEILQSDTDSKCGPG